MIVIKCSIFQSKRLVKAGHERPQSCIASVWSKLQRFVLTFSLSRKLFTSIVLCFPGEGTELRYEKDGDAHRD